MLQLSRIFVRSLHFFFFFSSSSACTHTLFKHSEYSVRIESAINYPTNARKTKTNWTPIFKLFLHSVNEVNTSERYVIASFASSVFLSINVIDLIDPLAHWCASTNNFIAVARFNYLIKSTTVWRIIIWTVIQWPYPPPNSELGQDNFNLQKRRIWACSVPHHKLVSLPCIHFTLIWF